MLGIRLNQTFLGFMIGLLVSSFLLLPNTLNAAKKELAYQPLILSLNDMVLLAEAKKPEAAKESDEDEEDDC